MPSGLQVWAPDGRLKIDTSTISFNLLGELTVGGAGFPKTGSIYESRFSLGTPFFAIVAGAAPSREQNFPDFRTEGNYLIWEYKFDEDAAYRRLYTKVVYGIR